MQPPQVAQAQLAQRVDLTCLLRNVHRHREQLGGARRRHPHVLRARAGGAAHSVAAGQQAGVCVCMRI